MINSRVGNLSHLFWLEYVNILADQNGECNRDVLNQHPKFWNWIWLIPPKGKFWYLRTSRLMFPWINWEVYAHGYSKHQVIDSFKEVSKDNPNKDISSLWPAVLSHLCEYLVYSQVEANGRENRSTGSSNERHVLKIVISDNGERPLNLRVCSSANHSITESGKNVGRNLKMLIT